MFVGGCREADWATRSDEFLDAIALLPFPACHVIEGREAALAPPGVDAPAARFRHASGEEE
jgi:hypothetical protein